MPTTLSLPANPSLEEQREILLDTYCYYVIEKNPVGMDPIVKRCKYRADNGGMCAIGRRIPDELYQATWDENWGEGINTVFNSLGIEASQSALKFYEKLQNAHDDFALYDSLNDFNFLAAELDVTLPNS